MLLFIALIGSVQCWSKDELAQDLQSTGGQVKLFSEFLSTEHLNYAPEEKALRFRNFRTSLKEVVKINSEQGDWESTINFMSAMTEEEKKQYYGINITAHPVGEWDADAPIKSDKLQAGSVNWRTKGKVSVVRNQGSCGSCWAFAGISSFEGHYAVKTGALKRFSEQEFLDCTYNDNSGCKGGWYWTAYDNTVARTQHLALSSSYPYNARDGACRTSSTKNGMTATKCTGSFKVSKGSDSALATALNSGPVAMAFEIKGGFSSYKTGILSINNCGGTPHHAMGVVGYSSDHWDIKNSWGSGWGDRGFVKFSRRIRNMCGISNWAAYPKLTKTGDDDGGDDGGNDDGGDCKDNNSSCNMWTRLCNDAKYKDFMSKDCKKTCKLCGGNDGGDANCKDSNSKCAGWKQQGYCSGKYAAYMAENCKASCGKCGGGKCNPGLTFCDGECKHAHFCGHGRA